MFSRSRRSCSDAVRSSTDISKICCRQETKCDLSRKARQDRKYFVECVDVILELLDSLLVRKLLFQIGVFNASLKCSDALFVHGKLLFIRLQTSRNRTYLALELFQSHLLETRESLLTVFDTCQVLRLFECKLLSLRFLLDGDMASSLNLGQNNDGHRNKRAINDQQTSESCSCTRAWRRRRSSATVFSTLSSTLSLY